MPTTWDPAHVGDDLVALTRLLGEPHRDLAVLAEGNTSELLDDGRLVVKASGAGLASVTADDFVVVDVAEVMAVVEDPPRRRPTSPPSSSRRGPSEATAVVRAAAPSRPSSTRPSTRSRRTRARRPASSATPTPPTSSGCWPARSPRRRGRTWSTPTRRSSSAARSSSPYATPGIDLGRVYVERLRAYVDAHGALPQLVLLANHGIVALAPTVEGVEAVSTMAVKGARVRATAYAVGGVAPLTDAAVEKFFARDDVAERRLNLTRGR